MFNIRYLTTCIELLLLFHAPIFLALHDVVAINISIGTHNSALSTPNNPIQFTLFFNFTIYQFSLSPQIIGHTYSITTTAFDTIKSSDCPFIDAKIMMQNDADAALDVNSFSFETAPGIWYGISGRCIDDALNQTQSWLYWAYWGQYIMKEASCNSGFSNVWMCVDTDITASLGCGPYKQMLYFDTMRPNQFINNATWSDATDVEPDIISCDPTDNPTVQQTTGAEDEGAEDEGAEDEGAEDEGAVYESEITTAYIVRVDVCGSDDNDSFEECEFDEDDITNMVEESFVGSGAVITTSNVWTADSIIVIMDLYIKTSRENVMETNDIEDDIETKLLPTFPRVVVKVNTKDDGSKEGDEEDTFAFFVKYKLVLIAVIVVIVLCIAFVCIFFCKRQHKQMELMKRQIHEMNKPQDPVTNVNDNESGEPAAGNEVVHEAAPQHVLATPMDPPIAPSIGMIQHMVPIMNNENMMISMLNNNQNVRPLSQTGIDDNTYEDHEECNDEAEGSSDVSQDAEGLYEVQKSVITKGTNCPQKKETEGAECQCVSNATSTAGSTINGNV
eukprot:46638_1